MPRYEDTETQVLGQLPVTDHLRDTIARFMEEALARAAETARATPATVDAARLTATPNPANQAVSESTPTPVPVPAPQPRRTPPSNPPPTPPPSEKPWYEQAWEGGRNLALSLITTPDLPFGAWGTRLAEDLGLRASQEELRDRLATETGISLPVQQWLKEHTEHYQVWPGEPPPGAVDWGGLYLPASKAVNKPQLLTYGDPNKSLVAVAGHRPATYAHEALHAWGHERLENDPELRQAFVNAAFEVAGLAPHTLPDYQRPAWEAADRFRAGCLQKARLSEWIGPLAESQLVRLLGADLYSTNVHELHSYLGETAWRYGLDALPEPVRPFYFDFYAAG